MRAFAKTTSVLSAALLGGLLAAAVAQAQTVIEVHNTVSPGGSEETSLLKFKELLEERSDGRFQVNVYLGGQLGGEVEVLELLNLGQTHVALTGTTYIAQYADEYDALNIPFVLPSWESSVAFMESESGQRIKQLALERGGIRHLALQQRGARQMTANRRIENVADMRGLTMRVPPQPSWISVWESLGAQTVVLPAGDIYLAMRTGQIDAHENTLSSPYSRQMWEVQDHIILTNHLHNPWSYVASEAWLQRLSEEDQEMIREVAVEAAAHGGAAEVELQDYYLRRLAEEGMTIVEVDVDAFNEAAQPVIDEWLSRKAEGVRADVAASLQAGRAAD